MAGGKCMMRKDKSVNGVARGVAGGVRAVDLEGLVG
jgi:hypothetical protein